MEEIVKEISDIHTEMRKMKNRYLKKYKHSDDKLKRGPKQKVDKIDCESNNFSFVHATTDELYGNDDARNIGQSFKYNDVRICTIYNLNIHIYILL
jgi:hypothetical protein